MKEEGKMSCVFWKPETLPGPRDLEVRIAALGKGNEVADRLLSIPKSRPYLSSRIMDGYASVIWLVGSGVVLDFREEPEFGEPAVFSLILARRMVGPKDFYRFYAQVYEMFGAILLEEGAFVTVDEFKEKL